jgi:hypothetical protein
MRAKQFFQKVLLYTKEKTMNKRISRITSIMMALTLTFGSFTSGKAKSDPTALAAGGTVNLAFFYKPPTNSDAATVASNFNTIILTGGDESFRNQLVSKGLTTTVTQYYGTIGIQNPGNCTSSPRKNQVAYNAGDFCSISQNHPDWFLLDTNGQRIPASPGSDTYRMDPGNPGWRNFFVTRVLEWQQKNGWSGLFLDNLEASLSDIQRNGSKLAKYPDDASYQAAIRGFLEYLKVNYSQPYNRPIFANIIARRDEATWFSYLQYLDGAMQERWSVDWSTTVYVSETKWKNDMALAEKTQSQGKTIILVAPGTETDANRQNFAFASYLLISNGKSAFRYSSVSKYGQVWLYSNYQADLGTPLGPRYQNGSLWRRDFTKGYVIVDPVNHTATISTNPLAASAPTSTPISATPSVISPTPLVPTTAPIQATSTALQPTAILQPTFTSVPPTAISTSIPPTSTSTIVPNQPSPTEAILQATFTSVPPTAISTSIPPTNNTSTSVPEQSSPTAVILQPTFTSLPPTIASTSVPDQPSPTEAILQATFTSVPPTATSTSIPSTSTSTSVPIQPSPTANVQSALSSNLSTGSGMWISSSELMSLPTSGTAWDKMRTAAYGSWGTPDLKNKDNKHDINLLAGALVYARTGDPALRSKVRDGIIAAKRTLDESSEWQMRDGVLSAGRQIGAYVISADLINLKNYDASADNEFRSWLTTIRTTNIGTHGRWKAITYTCENAAANWSTFACASRIAASIYLGDTADVDRAASIIRAFFGERSAYPANAPGKNGYFQHTAGYDASWACAEATWTGINPACMKSGINVDGVLVEDASRGGGCCVLQGSGIGYSWEALQGLFVSAELLYRTGRYGDPYSWSNQALKRAMDFMQRSGWGIGNVATYVPWMANARYNTNYPTKVSVSGRIMSWGSWLYQK